MRRYNLHTAEAEYDTTDPDGFRAGEAARVSAAIGARDLVGRMYELPAGESNCPYHYEYGCDEWLIVLSGRVHVRHPEGEEELDAGDVVCFPEGPEGAHRITGASEDPARVLMLSKEVQPAVSVYPDSDKIGVWTRDEADDAMLHRRDGRVDYWEGER